MSQRQKPTLAQLSFPTVSQHCDNVSSNNVVTTLLCQLGRDTKAVISELNSNSSKPYHWFQHNYFKANPGKCHLLLSSKTVTDVSIGDASIKTSTKETLFGILIDSELSFNQHISHICSKASKKLHALGCIASFISFNKHLLSPKSIIVP